MLRHLPRSAQKELKVEIHYHYWINKECYCSIPIPEKKMQQINKLPPGSLGPRLRQPTPCAFLPWAHCQPLPLPDWGLFTLS